MDKNMTKIEQIKEDIIDRYNMTFEPSIDDNTGLIESLKENFKALLDSLIEEVKNYYTQQQPNY